jgi:hypothetical protein
VELAPSEVGRYGLLHSESAAEGSLSGK